DLTWTPTVPAAWGGATATACESDTIVTDAASTPPNRTCNWPAAPEKLRPLTVTDVPPPAGPEVTLRPLTRGVRSTTSKSVALIACTCRTFDMFHWVEGIPVKNMSEPLSATISP